MLLIVGDFIGRNKFHFLCLLAWRTPRFHNAMIHVLFTLDYEIHGNGEGSPLELMVAPTDRMLGQFDKFGARLTILADVAEILKFKEYGGEAAEDEFHYWKIEAQLRKAIQTGHDVQLHLHPSYFNTQYEGGRWRMDWSEYDFATLHPDRMRWMLRTGRDYLEALLRPVNDSYRCNVFRAANWAAQPSPNVVRSLIDAGFVVDTSVFKYGHRAGRVNFDYSHAPSAVLPWRASEKDICVEDPDGRLWEAPIYCEQRWLGAFLTINRLYRVWQSYRHKFPKPRGEGPASGSAGNNGRYAKARAGLWDRFFKNAWKADFNQCSGRQLVNTLKRVERIYDTARAEIPFVLIGHSKLFTPFNQTSLEPFLKFVAAHPEKYCFSRFNEMHWENGAKDTAQAAKKETPSLSHG